MSTAANSTLEKLSNTHVGFTHFANDEHAKRAQQHVDENAQWAAKLKNHDQKVEEVHLGVGDYLLPYSKKELEALIRRFDHQLRAKRLSNIDKTEETPLRYFIQNREAQWRQLFLWNLTSHTEETIKARFEQITTLQVKSVDMHPDTKTAFVTFWHARGPLTACKKLTWSHQDRRGKIKLKNAGGVKSVVYFDLAHVGRKLTISNLAPGISKAALRHALLKYCRVLPEDIEEVKITRSKSGYTQTSFVNMRSSHSAQMVLSTRPLVIDGMEVDVTVADIQKLRNVIV